MATFSRRDVVRWFGSVLTPLCVRGLSGSPAAPSSVKLSLAREFPKSSMRAVSPNGTNLCVEDWNERGYPLRVLEIGDWTAIYTGRFDSRALAVSFFSDGKTLLVQAMASVAGKTCGVGKGNCAHDDIILDLRSGERTERVTPFGDLSTGDHYYPLADKILLVARFEAKPYQTQTLALTELPSRREIAKVPYATGPRKPRPIVSGIALSTEYGFAISDDRKTLVYSFDDVLVARNTEDLAVMWTQRIELDLKAYNVVVSAHGSHVAAAIADNTFPHLQHASYVAVYDGKDGSDVTRLPQNGTEGIALSPDGKFIAVVRGEAGTKGEVVPTVHIHELPSGRRLTSVVHDRIKSGRHQRLEAGCSVAFTSDGKYLITSGMATRVWRIEA
jgi:WD40 repeat protein